MSIQVQQLTKIFGKQKAVDSISFEAKAGEILGFLGPNGAGKSTTMKIATGYLPLTSGEVKVAGFDVTSHPIKVQQRIGYLPEHNPLYPDMYVKEYLSFIASLHRIKGAKKKKRIKEMVELCGLSLEQHKKIGSLSKGYRQRVGLAQALVHDPQVLILDEPTTGLDPNQLVEVRKLIKQASAEKTVILSTHIMQEVEALCDRVVIINQGKIVADDTVSGLLAGKGKQVLKVEFQEDLAVDDFEELEGIGIEKVHDRKYKVQSTKYGDVQERLFKFAAAKGWVILSMQLENTGLERVFHELTSNKDVGNLS